MRKLIFALLMMACSAVHAQIVQTIRGEVIDKESEIPLVGVNVVIKDSNPIIGTATDANGDFEFKDLPIGKYTLEFTYLGYSPYVARDIQLNSGKQKVLNIELEERVITTDEVVVKAYRKGETLNKMAAVSARSFSVNETERYAGSLGDPARMASNYAGVSQAGDDRNDIIIRGNSPTGLQWRLEGIDIPSPNHWGASGTTGGPVSILNNNTLANSDFFTGAFPAEYGNALSGVFDLNLRSGNNQLHEFTGQIGFNGFELMSEGPFSKNYKGSYMASFRYSVLEVMDMIGFSAAGGAVPEYHDFTFKTDFPTKKAGHFSFFGLGGRSNIDLIGGEVEDEQKYNTIGTVDTYNGSDLGILGLTNKYFIDDKSYVYSAIALSGTRVYTTIDSTFRDTVFSGADTILQKRTKLFYGEENTEIITNASVKYVRKINAKNSFNLGVGLKHQQINYQDSFINESPDTLFYQYSTQTQKSGLFTSKAYFQWLHKFTDRLEVNAGIHYRQFLYNNTYAVEPRAGLTWEPVPSHKISFGYGRHGKLQPIFYYFVETYDSLAANYAQTNSDLEFTKADHFVLAYDHLFTENLRLKVETYYQNLFNVPVEQRASNYSMLNEGASFHLFRTDSLVNEGTGKNYGIEMTVEKYLNNHWYFLFTGSLFDSKYTGSDGVERNTAFAANYATNVLGGYEYRINQQLSIDANARLTWAGGKRNYYLDEEASLEQGEAVYDASKAFSEREKDYFRFDLRISLKSNKKNYSQEWAIDLTNLTNHKNVFSRSYNADEGEIEYIYQQGLFPMFLYRINF